MRRALEKIVRYVLPPISSRLLNIVLERRVVSYLDSFNRNGNLINVIFDIGAHKGRWSSRLKKDLPESDFYLFEANPSHIPDLQRTGFPFHIGVLSDAESRRKFYKINGTGDSMYRENSNLYCDSGAVDVMTEALDDVVSRKNIPLPDMIKIDTQGSEIEVLQGAQRSVSNARFILLECPVLLYNIGSPKMNKYLDYMDTVGYSPAMLCESHESNGQLFQVDILFTRKDLVDAC